LKRFLQFKEYDSTETYILDKYDNNVIDAIKQIKKVSNDFPCELDIDFEINNIIKITYEINDLKEWYQHIQQYYVNYNMCETEDEKEQIIKYLKIIADFYKW